MNAVPLVNFRKRGLVDPLTGKTVAPGPVRPTRKRPNGEFVDGRFVVGFWKARNLGLIKVVFLECDCPCACFVARVVFPLVSGG